MVEKIISLLEERDLNSKELLKKIDIESELLDITISDMMNKGIIIETSKKRYKLVSKTSLKKGIVYEKKNGSVVVEVDNEDIYILNKDKISNRDIVLVDIDSRYGNNDKIYGKVVKILERYNPNVVCEVIKRNDKHYAIYEDNLLTLYGDNLDELTSGYMVLLKRDTDSNNAKVLEVIGHKDAIDMSITPYAYEYGFYDKFPDGVLRELESIPSYLSEEEINRLINEEDYIDLRNEMLFTIDGADTKDIDDAVSLRENADGTYTLITSIALPSYYIKRDSMIYQDVITRGTSAYPKGKVIPMNHPKLSNEICSLNEQSDRVAISYFTIYDKNGKCKKVDIKLSIINSNIKMSYDKVNKILEDNEMVSGYEKYVDKLRSMNVLKNILKKRMINDGFLRFYSPEVKIKYDENNNVSFEKRQNRTAEELIEFFMLATNEDVTTHLSRRGLNLIYRIDDEPSQLRLAQVMNFINTKYRIDIKEKYNREDIKKVLKIIEGTKEEKILNSQLIRCMSRAKFSNENIGHYATGKKVYGMHTSPIRRATDFINQCIILDYLKYGVEYANMLWEEELEELAKHFTEREEAETKLEQKILKIEQAKYLSNFVGQTFTGIISSVTEFGFYVEIDEMFEGLVNLSTLGRVKYIPEMFAYLDKETKEMYSLGDEVEIIIKRVTDEFKVDFELVGESYVKKEEKGKVKKKTL